LKSANRSALIRESAIKYGSDQLHGPQKPKMVKCVSKGRQKDPHKDDMILTAANELFLSRGYNVPLNEIAIAAGVSKQTIYARHAGKRELLDAVVRRTTMELINSFDIPYSGEEFESSLKKFGAILIDILFDPKRLTMHRLLITVAPKYPDLARHYYNCVPGTIIAELTKRIDAEASTGRLLIENTSACASFFVGLIICENHIGSLMRVSSIPDKIARKRRVNNAVSAFLKIYRPDGDC